MSNCAVVYVALPESLTRGMRYGLGETCVSETSTVQCAGDGCWKRVERFDEKFKSGRMMMMILLSAF